MKVLMDEQNTTFTPTPQPNINQNVPSQTKKPKSKMWLYVLVTLLIAGAAAAAVYAWQMNQNNALNSELDANAKITDLEGKLAVQTAANSASASAPTPTTSTSPDLIPGNADTNRDDGSVYVDAIFKYSLAPTAVWVEYGTEPSKLDKATSKITDELGLGDPGSVYATGFSTVIKKSEVKPGTVYYYRTAATVKGKTQVSAVASFQTIK
jgi:flagellar basal body-associated protein FliL